MSSHYRQKLTTVWLTAISWTETMTVLSNIQKGLDTGDQDEKQALLFNEIVAYEKKMDYASAKEKITAYLEAYPTDERAVKENYFLETR